MKLKLFLITLLSSMSLFSSSLEINLQKCTVCHLTVQPGDEFDYSKLVAPPFMGVMMHVKQLHQTEEDAIDFIVEYVNDPEGMRSEAVCSKRTIKRFGYMPSQEGIMSEEELREVAKYLYENFGDKKPH